MAEHLPPGAANILVSTLTGHGDIVMFSAARPGQGGERHLNERPYEYWRQLFRRRGYGMYDAVRPLIHDPRVEPGTATTRSCSSRSALRRNCRRPFRGRESTMAYRWQT